jgi:hypothetical protein
MIVDDPGGVILIEVPQCSKQGRSLVLERGCRLFQGSLIPSPEGAEDSSSRDDRQHR